MNRILDEEVFKNIFKGQIKNKEILLSKLDYDLTSALQQATNLKTKKISHVVHSISEIITTIASIFSQVIYYLTQNGHQFLSQFIFSSLKLTNKCFKGLSCLFLGFVRNVNSKESKIHETDNKKEQKPKDVCSSYKRKLEKFDFFIKSIEEEELKLMNEKIMAEQNLFYQKQSLAKVNASQAPQELQQLDIQIQKMIQNSQRLSDQNYLFRHQQLSKQILTFKKPEQLLQIISAQRQNSFSQKLEPSFQKILALIHKYMVKRSNQIGKKKEQQKRSQYIQKQVQTEQIRNKNEFKKKKKSENDEENKKFIESLKKDIIRLTRELNEIKELQRDYRNKCEGLEQMLRKKMTEIQKNQMEYNYNITKKDQYIQSLKDKNQSLKKQYEDIKGNQEDGNSQFQSNLRSTARGISNQRECKRNFTAKKCLKQLIRGIQGTLAMPVSTDEELENQVNQGIIEAKVQQIKNNFQLLQQKIQNTNKQKLYDISLKQKVSAHMTASKGIQAGNDYHLTKLADKRRQSIKKSINEEKTLRSTKKITSTKHPLTEQNRLESLKKELMKRVQLGKSRGSKIIRKNESRFFNQENMSQTMRKLSKKGEQNNSKHKQNQISNRKDISFQELKLTRHSEFEKKKIKQKQTNKTKQYILTEPNEPCSLLSIGNVDVIQDVGKVMNYLQLKNDGNNNFLKQFLIEILGEVNSKKGSKILNDVMKPFLKSGFAF